MQYIRKDMAGAKKWYEDGLCLQRQHRYREAVAAFDRAITADRDFADAHFEKGVCLYRLNLLQASLDSMDAACLLGCARAQLWSRFEMPDK